MSAARPLPVPSDPEATDHFVYLRGVRWSEYEALLAMRGERSVPRITYLEGTLELMSPSKYHEKDKTFLGRLLEAWAIEKGIQLEGYGSWTLKNSKEERGVEPDECYTINRIPVSEDDRPDIAIEVIWTSGGINKLEVYRKLGVKEVWYYERGSLRFYTLEGDAYGEIARSALLPDAEPSLFVRCMGEASQTDAVRALLAALRSGSK
ncbi:MAG TPA: Uma2 family endonuclease [Polyangiaceae bacterium]|nr:Uma2 family endonuclease [Polyangiaceae bacterium]